MMIYIILNCIPWSFIPTSFTTCIKSQLLGDIIRPNFAMIASLLKFKLLAFHIWFLFSYFCGLKFLIWTLKVENTLSAVILWYIMGARFLRLTKSNLFVTSIILALGIFRTPRILSFSFILEVWILIRLSSGILIMSTFTDSSS